MRKGQISLQILKHNGQADGRSLRWQKTPSFVKLYREGQMGGALRYRKAKRPFSSKAALHVVLKSEFCQKTFSFSHPAARLQIKRTAKALAKKCHLRLYKIAVVGNHLHLLLHAKRREAVTNFLRAFSGVVAKRMRKWAFRKKLKISLKESFWSGRPFSRIVRFGRAWQVALRYLEKNRLEALGFISLTPRKHSLPKILEQIEDRLSRSFSSA